MIAILLLLLLDTRSVTPRPISPVRLTACDLVTRADVEQALGRPVAAGAEDTAAAGSTCDYAGRDGLVSVAIQRLAAKPDRAVEIGNLRHEIPDGAFREASAFRDAFFWDIPGAGTQLHVLAGERHHLMVSVLGFGEAARVSSAAEQIARKAVGRL